MYMLRDTKVLFELSRLGKIIKKNIIMTAEEYLKSKIIYDNGYEPHSVEVVSKIDALKAIEMVRNEKVNNTVGMQGWICPKCGRVYSPTTSMCSYCSNDKEMFKPYCGI